MAFSHHMTGAPFHECLGFKEAKLALCWEKERGLWREFFLDKDRTDLGAYSKWFEELERDFDEKRFPPVRAGYYLGFRAVAEALRNIGGQPDWAELSRLGSHEILAVMGEQPQPPNNYELIRSFEVFFKNWYKPAEL